MVVNLTKALLQHEVTATGLTCDNYYREGQTTNTEDSYSFELETEWTEIE